MKKYASRQPTILYLYTLAICSMACTSAGPVPSADAGPSVATDPLPGWKSSTAKRSILSYIDRVTQPGSADFIPPEDRIATFDFDGTIGCEKPDYMEVMVAMARMCEESREQPELARDPLYSAACEGDYKTINAQVEKVLLEAFDGQTQSFYVDYVERFLGTAHHPRFDKPYGRLYYVPMLELIQLLEDHAFAVYIVSGSQQGFTRTYADHILGIPAARAIGHTVELDFSWVDGHSELVRQDAFLPPSVDGAGKAEIIRNRIGTQPVLAFGNSMGDFEMLQYATSNNYPSLGLILVHDDPEEYVYRDETLIQHAEANGWQMVGMKESFEQLFPR